MANDDGEGEGLYRYIPAAVVCNIMITLPGCLAVSPLPRFPPTRSRLRGHPLSAAMLPGNMIIVIICTLLRPHPPDSSPPRGNPLSSHKCPPSSLFLSFFHRFVPPSFTATMLATLPSAFHFLRPSRSPFPFPPSLTHPPRSDSILSSSRYTSLCPTEL